MIYPAPTVHDNWEVTLTVLFSANPKNALKGFAPKGRYSYVSLLLYFAADWKVDLPWVQTRVREFQTSNDLLVLFRDIITADHTRCGWAEHPDAPQILLNTISEMHDAWNRVLAHAPDRDQLTLEYLADALESFQTASRTN